MPAPEGHCDPRFTSVRAAFRQNFAERGEQGAALTLHVDGRVVAGLAFGYVMNQMGPRWQNPRTRALVDAAYACL